MQFYIRHYLNVLPKDFCDHLINKFDSIETEQRQIDNHMLFSELNICRTPNLEEERNFIYANLATVVPSYRSSCKIDAMQWDPNFGWEEVRMKKYIAGEGIFNDHVDVRDYASARRFLSFLVYLNDVEEGGETVFYKPTGEQLKVKPEAGSVIVFPPTWMYPHKGTTPISNDKYILSSYLHYS